MAPNMQPASQQRQQQPQSRMSSSQSSAQSAAGASGGTATQPENIANTSGMPPHAGPVANDAVAAATDPLPGHTDPSTIPQNSSGTTPSTSDGDPIAGRRPLSSSANASNTLPYPPDQTAITHFTTTTAAQAASALHVPPPIANAQASSATSSAPNAGSVDTAFARLAIDTSTHGDTPNGATSTQTPSSTTNNKRPAPATGSSSGSAPGLTPSISINTASITSGSKRPAVHLRYHRHESPITASSPGIRSPQTGPLSARTASLLSPSGVSPVRMHAPHVAPSSQSPPTAFSATPTGIVGTLLLRKPGSVAFFIALLSPDEPSLTSSTPPLPVIDVTNEASSGGKSGTASSTIATGPPIVPSIMSPRSLFTPKPIDTTRITKPVTSHQHKPIIPSKSQFKPKPPRQRPPPHELNIKISMRQAAAASARLHLLQTRRARLGIYAEHVRMRAMLQRQRSRLQLLQLQAKTDYSMASATMKREALLHQRLENLIQASEHAHAVMLMQKLKRFMTLRRAVSDNLVDMICDMNIGGSDFDMASVIHENDDDRDDPSSGVVTDMMQGLRVEASTVDDDDEYEMSEYQVVVPPSSATLSVASSVSPNRPSSHNGQTAYSATSMSTDGSSARVATAVETEMDHSPVKSTTTRATSTPPRTRGDLLTDDETRLHPVSSTRTSRKESLATTLRRSKSLSSTLLLETDDFTYLELLSLLPPVTRFTLRELDMDEILSNAQLRHDLVFDADLQFKPNTDTDTDTESGDPRSTKSDAYWDDVGDEVMQGYLYRVPLLLAEIRAILVELLPNGREIKDDIDAHIDVNLIAQQIDHGVMNPVGLIEYIAHLMKLNCAPIRDELVDKMVAVCRDGDVVKTLRICFDVLELMKLDYANHQLTRLRPYVVEHAVEFEWKWFKGQFENGSVSLSRTKAWLRTAYEKFGAGADTTDMAVTDPVNPTTTDTKTDTKTSTSTNVTTPASRPFTTTTSQPRAADAPRPRQDFYFDALLHLILQANKFSDTPSILPETLRLDTSRLVSYYNDWQDITILSTLLVLFRQASGPKCTIQHLSTSKTNLWVLLNDAETTMTHISLQITQDAGVIRGAPFNDKDRDLFTNMLEKTLSPDSKVYDMIQKRVGESLRYIATSVDACADKNTLAKHGLTQLETEINDLGVRIRKVGELNRAVYGHVYMAMLEDIIAEKKVVVVDAVKPDTKPHVSTRNIGESVAKTNKEEDEDELASPRLAAAMRAI